MNMFRIVMPRLVASLSLDFACYHFAWNLVLLLLWLDLRRPIFVSGATETHIYMYDRQKKITGFKILINKTTLWFIHWVNAWKEYVFWGFKLFTFRFCVFGIWHVLNIKNKTTV